MASTAPSKIFFNYLAKRAIRDLERKRQGTASTAAHRRGGAKSKQWALMEKIMGRKKRTRRKKAGAGKARRKRQGGKRGKRGSRKVGGARRRPARAVKARGGRRRRKRGRPKTGAGKRAPRRRRAGAVVGGHRKKGGKRRRGRKKRVKGVDGYVLNRSAMHNGAPMQQSTGALRASHPSPNALRSLSSVAFSNVQKSGLQPTSPLQLYKQRL